jgi:hypothetical protein
VPRTRAARETHRGHDPVLAAGEEPEHFRRLGAVARLAEDPAAEQHERVRGADPGFRPARRNGGRLFRRQPRCRALGRLARRDLLDDVRGNDDERDPERRQDLRPARGRRSQHEIHSPIINRQSRIVNQELVGALPRRALRALGILRFAQDDNVSRIVRGVGNYARGARSS